MNAWTILWRRLDQAGHEAARLSFQDSEWRLEGSAVFVHEGQACRLDYRVVCDASWQTRSGRVAGWVGSEEVKLEISVDGSRRWLLNGIERPEVAGCTDLDLNFSPSTNLLPVRRLNLAIGEAAQVRAAWLRFPGFELQPLDQTYRRLEERLYRYESAGGAFITQLPVDEVGFVTGYPNFWMVERR